MAPRGKGRKGGVKKEFPPPDTLVLIPADILRASQLPEQVDRTLVVSDEALFNLGAETLASCPRWIFAPLSLPTTCRRLAVSQKVGYNPAQDFGLFAAELARAAANAEVTLHLLPGPRYTVESDFAGNLQLPSIYTDELLPQGREVPSSSSCDLVSRLCGSGPSMMPVRYSDRLLICHKSVAMGQYLDRHSPPYYLCGIGSEGTSIGAFENCQVLAYRELGHRPYVARFRGSRGAAHLVLPFDAPMFSTEDIRQLGRIASEITPEPRIVFRVRGAAKRDFAGATLSAPGTEYKTLALTPREAEVLYVFVKASADGDASVPMSDLVGEIGTEEEAQGRHYISRLNKKLRQHFPFLRSAVIRRVSMSTYELLPDTFDLRD